MIGLELAITGFFISPDIDGDARVVDMKFRKRVRFNFALVKNGLKLKQLWQTLVFYIIVAFFTPNFKDYLDYYYNFGSVLDGSVEMAMFIGILGATILFSWKLKDMEIRTLQIVACIFHIMNCCLNLCLTLNFKFGLTTF